MAAPIARPIFLFVDDVAPASPSLLGSLPVVFPPAPPMGPSVSVLASVPDAVADLDALARATSSPDTKLDGSTPAEPDNAERVVTGSKVESPLITIPFEVMTSPLVMASPVKDCEALSPEVVPVNEDIDGDLMVVVMREPAVRESLDGGSDGKRLTELPGKSVLPRSVVEMTGSGGDPELVYLVGVDRVNQQCT